MQKIMFIPMPVKNARNVNNAVDIISTIDKELDVKCLGCKDNEIGWNNIKKIHNYIKAAKKQSLLEIMADENHWMDSAEMAVQIGFDIVIGTHYSKNVADLFSNNNIKYYPFIGKLTDYPIYMVGTIDEIVNEAVSICEKNVAGITVPLYHYSGNTDALAHELILKVKKPMIVAGHVGEKEQIVYLKNLGFYGFTMGTQLIDQKYVECGSFVDNINVVSEWIKEMYL